MHPALLAAYDQALPRLDAAERLAAIGVAGIAAGTVPREQARRIVADLRAQANPGRLTRGAERPRSGGELAAGARARGIAVRAAVAPPGPGGSSHAPEPPEAAQGPPEPAGGAS